MSSKNKHIKNKNINKNNAKKNLNSLKNKNLNEINGPKGLPCSENRPGASVGGNLGMPRPEEEKSYVSFDLSSTGFYNSAPPTAGHESGTPVRSNNFIEKSAT